MHGTDHARPVGGCRSGGGAGPTLARTPSLQRCTLPRPAPTALARRLLARRSGANPLPEGTTAIGLGLVISGLTSYGFLVVAARALGPDRYAPVSAMWAITFLAAPGFFLPVEQEVGRALAERRSRGQGGGPVVKRAAQLGGILTLLLVALAVVFAGPLMEHLFADSVGLLVGFVLGLVGYYAGHLGRGTLSGNQRFGAYGVFMGAEGIVRLVMCVALAVAGVHALGPYGIAVGFPPLVAIALAVRGQRGLIEPGPDAPWSELTANLGWLLLGSVLAAALVNVGPIAVKLLATGTEEAETGRFQAGMVITRVPLFLFQAVQASLLPKLAALAGAGLYDDFRRGFRRLLAVVGVVAVVAVAGAFAVGPFVVRTLFGAEYDLGRRTVTLLALASATYMIAVALAQALIALGGHARSAMGWAAGMVAFAAVTVAGNDVLLRVELGLVAGGTFAAVAFAGALLPLLRRDEPIDPGGLVDALHDLPMEP